MQLLNQIKNLNLLKLLVDFVAPKSCLVCHDRIHIQSEQNYICQECLDNIPFAPNSDFIISEMNKNFTKDDIAITEAFSLIGVTQDHDYMNLIYLLKYSNFPYSVEELYRLLARKIKYEQTANFDYIVPLPLHSAKKRERGYNQADYIAKGISKELAIPFAFDLVKRKRYTRTQTRVSKLERFSNIKNAFQVIDKETVKGKSILIADDVFTTGSSINECANTLLEAGARRVAAATLVYAGKY